MEPGKCVKHPSTNLENGLIIPKFTHWADEGCYKH